MSDKNRVCGICFEVVDPDVDFESHVELCREEQTRVLGAYFNVNEDALVESRVEKVEKKKKKDEPKMDLTKTQGRAVRFFRKKAKLMSNATHHLLVEKVIRLGFDETDLQILLDFVSRAPIISFVPLYRANLFVPFSEEPRMKNLFEVGRGGGTTNTTRRSRWESTLFNKLYDASEPEERVKYGAFNLDDNPEGVTSAKAYGDAYFVFHEHVKKRTTMVYGDSSGNASNLHIATPDYFENILHYLPDNVVNSMMLKALGAEYAYQNYLYVEIQIHGEVRLDRDVRQVVIKGESDHRLRELCEINDIEIVSI